MPENEKQEAVDSAAQQNQPAGGSAEQPKERIWTQSEVDAYVKLRIDKQNVRHAEQDAEKDARIAELEETSKASQAEVEALRHVQELQEWAAQASAETGVPASVIKGNSLEEMQEHAAQIKAVIPTYPTTKDSGAPAQVSMSKAQIMAIENIDERRAAIKENIELFSQTER